MHCQEPRVLVSAAAPPTSISLLSGLLTVLRLSGTILLRCVRASGTGPLADCDVPGPVAFFANKIHFFSTFLPFSPGRVSSSPGAVSYSPVCASQFSCSHVESLRPRAPLRLKFISAGFAGIKIAVSLCAAGMQPMANTCCSVQQRYIILTSALQVDDKLSCNGCHRLALAGRMSVTGSNSCH